MKVPLAVIDTNVVVSGLITAAPRAPTVRILDDMLAARFRFLLSDALIAEYRLVLLRPKIGAAHGLSSEEIDALLVAIVANALVRRPAARFVRGADPNDDHLWALLAAHPGAALVTGDRALHDPPRRARVLSPRAFVDLLEA